MKRFKVGEALQIKKRLGQEIAELVEVRHDNAWTDGLRQVPYMADTTEQMQEKVAEYVAISEQIMLSNCITKVSVPGRGEFTVASAILVLDMMRKEIASLTKVLKDRNKPAVYNRRSKDDVVYKENFDRSTVETEIRNLRTTRDTIARKLAISNWATEITVD